MSTTPITDAEYERQKLEYDGSREFDWPAFHACFDFARQLERDLSQAKADKDNLMTLWKLEQARRIECETHSKIAGELLAKSHGELAAAKADVERINYLERSRNELRCSMFADGSQWFEVSRYNALSDVVGAGELARDAIDAAMKGTP